MQLPSDFQAAFTEAKQHQAAGRVLDAERIFRQLAKSGAHRHIALEALADLFWLQQRFRECLDISRELIEIEPDSEHYSIKVASLLDALGQTDDAVAEYSRLLQQKPDAALVHYNIALLYRKQERYTDALSAYEEAIRLGIDRVEEVYANMGNVYSEMLDTDKTREMYQRAIDVAPDYIPALFHLANHYEESGESDLALEFYERVQAIDPKHWESLARLAYPRKITAENDSLVGRLKDRIDDLQEDKTAQEILYFALGKVQDDLEAYDDAAAAFVEANEASKDRVLPYDPEATERSFDGLIDIFDSTWIQSKTTDSDASPVFICGMYRSGSTFLERMLSGHPAIAAGGELKTLALLVAQHLGQFPQGAANATSEKLRLIADEYDRSVRTLAPDASLITDKRPDNFLRLGLARAIFPKTKIIQMRRDIRDNCLSVYFHDFSPASSYANNLENVAHYYNQQERLVAHWRECFDDSICTVDYEELIDSPEPVLRRVLEFLGLEWDPGVLDFDKSSGLVRTHSIWQVREGLYSRSKGRWRNYQALLGELAEGPVTDAAAADKNAP
jgi:tetratricopeptide (TPR) repeat protein